MTHRIPTRLLLLAVAALLAVGAVLVAGGGAARAEPSCTWSRQTDGSIYGVCVDDNGRTFCVQCNSAGRNCTRVRCG